MRHSHIVAENRYFIINYARVISICHSTIWWDKKNIMVDFNRIFFGDKLKINSWRLPLKIICKYWNLENILNWRIGEFSSYKYLSHASRVVFYSHFFCFFRIYKFRLKLGVSNTAGGRPLYMLCFRDSGLLLNATSYIRGFVNVLAHL